MMKLMMMMMRTCRAGTEKWLQGAAHQPEVRLQQPKDLAAKLKPISQVSSFTFIFKLPLSIFFKI